MEPSIEVAETERGHSIRGIKEKPNTTNSRKKTHVRLLTQACCVPNRSGEKLLIGRRLSPDTLMRAAAQSAGKTSIHRTFLPCQLWQLGFAGSRRANSL